MPKRMHQNNPAYRWFFENRFRLSETSERFRRSTDMRSGWTMHSRSFLVLSIPLLKFLRLDAYADHNPIRPGARARALQRVHQSRSIVGDALFAIIDRSTAVLFIHAVKKPLGAPGDEEVLRPGSVCVVRAAMVAITSH